MKSTPKTPARKSSAKPLRKSRKVGSLSRPETAKLLLQAKEAWGYQIAAKNIPADTSFDTFRHDEVMACVDLPGISKISREQWRTVSAHFLTLGGCESEAFELLQKTGEKTYRGGKPGDTWETAEAIVSHFRKALADHATTPAESLMDGKGHIHAGWFLHAARQRTRKPTLTMDTLAERLDPETLTGLLSHLRNHIARREGRETDRRSVRKYPAKPDPNQIDDPF